MGSTWVGGKCVVELARGMSREAEAESVDFCPSLFDVDHLA